MPLPGPPRRGRTPDAISRRRGRGSPPSMAVPREPPPAPAAAAAAAAPSFAAARALVARRYSCLVVAPHRRHVALPPRFLGRKRSGIRAQLDAELLRYSERCGRGAPHGLGGWLGLAANSAPFSLSFQPAGRAGGLRQYQGGGGARRHLRRPRIHPPEHRGGLRHLQPQEREEAGGM